MLKAARTALRSAVLWLGCRALGPCRVKRLIEYFTDDYLDIRKRWW